MHSHIHPATKIMPVIAMTVLLMNTAVADETPAPECLAMPDKQEQCCSGHAHHGGIAGVGVLENISTEIALTDTQKQELGALLEMYRPRIKELADRGMTSSQAMLEIAPDDVAYNTRAAELSQLAGASAAEMVTLLTELQANAYALLTAEQQAKFLELRAEQGQKMEARRRNMQQRRELGDWKAGQHFGHSKGKHCMHMPSPSDNTAASGATE